MFLRVPISARDAIHGSPLRVPRPESVAEIYRVFDV